MEPAMAAERVGGSTPRNELVTWGTPQARWVLLATVLGSGVAFLDATVVNVALPTIGTELDATVAGLQWILNAYTLTLASLILIGGSLGDRFGRRRVFLVGIAWFAAASLLCGLAPTARALVAARALQGVGGALLTPGSLAIIQASFAPGDRARAVGAWSGLSGIAAAVGPFVGGWLVGVGSWRLIFLINLPLAVAAFVVALRHVPETRDPLSVPGIDLGGAALTAAGLAGVSWSLTDMGERGTSAVTLAAGAAGLAALIALVAVEWRSRHPMLPLDIFRSRQFTAANLVTFVVYAGLGLTFFLLVVNLQQVVGYSPLQAGLAMLPITAIMLALSARAGLLAERIGPRLPMTVGPLSLAAGLMLLSGVQEGATYLRTVLPGVIVFGLGLTLTVAPLTATVLAAADARHAGIASGVNNAISRGAGLLAIAVIPGIAGLTGDTYRDPAAFGSGFRTAMLISAMLAAAGGVLAWLFIRNEVAGRANACPAARLDRRHHCAIDAAPLATHQDAADATRSARASR
ncbi:MAG TPA: MFS transporter [Vicinamibacterales bacterium]|jgi:EmrB/QacA subfamily drug resistance transporter|nr:MFS transporter [Vicinamibacterales bacterium]